MLSDPAGSSKFQTMSSDRTEFYPDTFNNSIPLPDDFSLDTLHKMLGQSRNIKIPDNRKFSQHTSNNSPHIDNEQHLLDLRVNIIRCQGS